MGALNKTNCDEIINLAKGKWEESGVNANKEAPTDEERITGINPNFGIDKKERIFGIDKKERISDISWTTDQWIYDIIRPYMEEANEHAGWKYDIKGAEGMQISRYKKGGFQAFHRDGAGDHLSAYDIPNNKVMHGHVRKLSMTVLLNDDYEGGEFQFATYSKEECIIYTPEFNKIGSIIMFPSYIEHGVTPVTKGIRYSLVTWFVGPPFK